MTRSPFITSAALHAVVIAILWCCAGASHPKLPPMPRIYVDLASLPELPAATAIQPERGSAAQAPVQMQSPPQAAEVVPKAAKAVAEPAEGSAKAEAAATVPAPAPAIAVAAQPVAGPAAPAVSSEISQAFARSSYIQQGMFRSRSYTEVAALAVRKMLEGKLATGELKEQAGGTARIEASYQRGGGTTFSVSADNERLQQLLEDQKAWAQVPAPDQYHLNYREVTFQVNLNHGAVRVGLTPR